jgi:hypothetical protein
MSDQLHTISSLALTETQTDHLIHLLEYLLKTFEVGVKALWAALAPFLLAYLAFRQARNRKEIETKIEENTRVSTDAFVVANGHNEKIARLTESVEAVVNKTKGTP